MGLKLGLLVLCLAAAGIRSASISPFQMVEEYVIEFEDALQHLKSSASYKFLQADYPSEKFNPTHAIRDAEEYDFIIVGSGASGSALASRLTEIPEWRVLLLEAGSSETTTTQVPAMQPYLRSHSYTWPHITVPQNHSCLGMEHHQCSVGNGRVLGGDTATNDMLYIRGHPRDYDIWADTGMIGWCWQSVRPFFKMMEDAFAEDLDKKEHYYGGPIHIENFEYSTPIAEHILEAAHEIGIKKIDYNGKDRLGLGIPQVTTKFGKRNSASQVYLTTAYRRKNLTIKPLSQVVNILISPHTKEAYGVMYLHEDHLYVAKARKEVILAAGAINTPHLLLLSGIGPKEHLEHFNIPVHSDLMVGHNLRDHLSFIGLNFVLDPHHLVKEHHNCESDVVEYLKDGKGPLTTTGLELVGFLKTEHSRDKIPYPDVEILVTRNIYNQGLDHLHPLRITEEIYDSIWRPLEGKQGFTIEVVLLHPKSKGYLKLHDGDLLHNPLINPLYLSDEDDEDVETLLAGIHKVLKLAETEAFKKLGAVLNPHKLPQCIHAEHEDDYWRCAIRHLSVSLRQVSGTARMGPETDREAVVDKDLRVYGIHKLRVADASIIPVGMSGNLMAVEYMIGEHAAEIIKEDWK